MSYIVWILNHCVRKIEIIIREDLSSLHIIPCCQSRHLRFISSAYVSDKVSQVYEIFFIKFLTQVHPNNTSAQYFITSFYYLSVELFKEKSFLNQHSYDMNHINILSFLVHYSIYSCQHDVFLSDIFYIFSYNADKILEFFFLFCACQDSI